MVRSDKFDQENRLFLKAEPFLSIDPITRKLCTNFRIVNDGLVVDGVAGRFASTAEEALAHYQNRCQGRIAAHLDTAAAARILAPSTVVPKPAATKLTVSIERVELKSLEYAEDEECWLYHVTSEPQAQKILREGFRPGQAPTMTNYSAYSAGKTFFSSRPGVSFWMERIEQHLFANHDNPPSIAILRAPQAALKDFLQIDTLGSEDSRSEAFYVTSRINQADALRLRSKARLMPQ